MLVLGAFPVTQICFSSIDGPQLDFDSAASKYVSYAGH
jgi:hypothetical protein